MDWTELIKGNGNDLKELKERLESKNHELGEYLKQFKRDLGEFLYDATCIESELESGKDWLKQAKIKHKKELRVEDEWELNHQLDDCITLLEQAGALRDYIEYLTREL